MQDLAHRVAVPLSEDRRRIVDPLISGTTSGVVRALADWLLDR